MSERDDLKVFLAKDDKGVLADNGDMVVYVHNIHEGDVVRSNRDGPGIWLVEMLEEHSNGGFAST